MVKFRQTNQLSDDEFNDILMCSNVVITHMTDGNSIEKEVTSVMGGEIFELSSEKIRREVKEELQPKIDELEAELAEMKAAIEDMATALADKDAALADKEAENRELKKIIDEK